MLLCSTRLRSATSSPKDISRATFDACANSIPKGWPCFWKHRAPGSEGCWKFPRSKPDYRPVGWLAPGINAQHAAVEAAKHEVEVIPLSRYSARRVARQGLLLGFAAVDARELRRGAEQLGAGIGDLPDAVKSDCLSLPGKPGGARLRLAGESPATTLLPI
jgi:hypothetical protein